MAEASKPGAPAQGGTLNSLIGLMFIVPAGCAFNYYWVSWSIHLVYGWSLYLGLAWSIFIVTITVAALLGLQAGVRESPSGGLLLFLGMVASPVVAFAGAYAALGFGLEKLGFMTYAGAGVESYKVIYKHFLWQFLDMVPELDIWKVLRIEDPASETNIWAGLLLITYKIFVIYVVIATLKKFLDD